MRIDLLSSFTDIIRSLPPLKGGEYYLDPGSGSFLIQIIIATLLGAVLVIRSSWGKIQGFFHRLFNKDSESTQDDE